MAQRMKAHRLRCKRPECGRMFEAWGKSQRFCSTSCGAKAHPPEWYQARQVRATAARLAKGYSRFVKRMRSIGLTDIQIAAVRRETQTARAVGHAAGKRLGWQEALRETGDEARWRKRRAA